MAKVLFSMAGTLENEEVKLAKLSLYGSKLMKTIGKHEYKVGESYEC